MSSQKKENENQNLNQKNLHCNNHKQWLSGTCALNSLRLQKDFHLFLQNYSGKHIKKKLVEEEKDSLYY